MPGANNPNYGRGVVEVGTLDLVDEERVRGILIEVMGAPNYRPPTLPAVALEVLNLSQRPNVSFNDVSKVLERDGMVTGQVLKLAQSPMFAGQSQVTSIQQAMVRLGLNTVRDLVVQVALEAKVFRCKPYAAAMESLRRHSTAVGHISRIVAKYTPFEADFAFLCGLLHDVGVAGALIALNEHAKPEPPPPLLEAWPAVMAVHEQSSELMARHWGLPADVSMVVGAHHQVKIQGYPHPVAALLALANDIALTMGQGLQLGTPKHGLASAEPPLSLALRAEWIEVVGLSDAQMQLISEETETLGEVLAGM